MKNYRDNVIEESLKNKEVTLPLDVLESFLKKANLNTYANKKAEKAASLRHGSRDYHFEKDDFFMTLILALLNLLAKRSSIKTTNRPGE